MYWSNLKLLHFVQNANFLIKFKEKVPFTDFVNISIVWRHFCALLGGAFKKKCPKGRFVGTSRVEINGVKHVYVFH